jgi:cell division protein ZapA (FtsZ GTPase activity inhibitor)
VAAKRSVAVRILGQEYRIRSEGDDASVQRIAARVDETMRRIRERTQTVDSLDLAILAALNLASHLEASGGERSAHAERGEWVDAERVHALLEVVEATRAGTRAGAR